MGQEKQRGSFQRRRESALDKTAARAEQFLFMAERAKRRRRLKRMVNTFMFAAFVLSALCAGWFAHMGVGG